MTGRLMRRSLLAHKTHMHNVNAYAQEHICTRALTLPPPPFSPLASSSPGVSILAGGGRGRAAAAGLDRLLPQRPAALRLPPQAPPRPITARPGPVRPGPTGWSRITAAGRRWGFMPGRAGSGRAVSGRVESGRAGSGRVGPGRIESCDFRFIILGVSGRPLDSGPGRFRP